MRNDNIIAGNNMKPKCLFIPGNSSSRAIFDSLQANGGRGLIFETEIDTLSNANSQEWGKFNDYIKKAFHNEMISINRTTVIDYIYRPCLSICMTGTYDQFRRLIKSTEDGHFSRYGFFTLNVIEEWQSHRPTKNSRLLEETICKESVRLKEMYELLNSRVYPIIIELTVEQFDIHDMHFSGIKQFIHEVNLSPDLHPSNHRLGLIAIRLICLFTLLRSFDNDPNSLSSIEKLVPCEKDITAAVGLADVFFEHTIRLIEMLPKRSGTKSKGKKYNDFINALPDTFSTAKAIEIGENKGISEPSVKRWLKSPVIEKIEHGRYRKV